MANVYTITLSSGTGAITSVDTLYVKQLNYQNYTDIYQDYYSTSNPPTTSNSIKT